MNPPRPPGSKLACSASCSPCPSNSSSAAGSAACTLCALYQYPASYLAATADSWNSSAQSFQDLSGNGRVGRLTAGSVSVETVAGHGAGTGISIPYVGGSPSTKILWGSLSVPSTFTICSISRFSGAAKQRILVCANRDWLHGHFGWGGVRAGATFYDEDININYTITPNTNWVVACGRNVAVGSGKVGTMINGFTPYMAFDVYGTYDIYGIYI